MRALFLTLSAVLTLAAQPALASCSISVAQAIAGSPYFGTGMLPAGQGGDGSLTFRNADDPRMIVNFTMAAAEPVGEVSRAEHVDRLEEYATFAVDRVRQQGRWAEKSIFPYDPVAWRTVEETTVDEVGPAFVGHMEIRLTPECILAADFISPASPNLRSRWTHMTSAVAGIRETAGALVVAETWERDDTTPVGITALAGGFVSPIGVIGLIYLLLGQLRRLDPPTRPTRTVLGSCAAVALGTLAYQYPAYVEGLDEMRYVDNLLLLGFVAVTCLAGAFLAQRAAVLGLLSACVSGIALSVASSLGWTPDVKVSFVIGAGLILMGVLGFYAWSEASGRPPRPSAG